MVRGHEGSGWQAAALATVVTVGLGACGSGSTRTDAATSNEQWIVPAEPTAIVAGDGTGWVRDDDGTMWRVTVDGSVEETEARVPEGATGGFHTFFAGRVVFGSARCTSTQGGDRCPQIVHEVVTVSADGRSETIEVAREDRLDDVESAELQLHGVVGDRLLMSTSASTVVELDANMGVSESAIPLGPDQPRPCVVDGVLYGIQDTSVAAAGARGEARPPQPESPVVDQSWTVTRWDGQSWALVPEGQHVAHGGTTVQCLADGFVVDPATPAPFTAVWTPTGGWHESPASVADLDVATSGWADPSNDHLVQDGQLLRVDLDDGLVPTPMSIDAADGESATDLYDASGTVLFACAEVDEGLRCTITPKD